jgi:prepilin-type N-terminal cleavage/methylation domain-containing protein
MPDSPLAGSPPHRFWLRNRRSGFTLVELMVSLVILTIMLVSLAGRTGIFVHTASTSTTHTAGA